MTVSLQTYSPAITHTALPAGADVEGLYVHIPFCIHKCHYCDFYSITRQTDERMEQFVDRVLREADLWTPDERVGPRVRPRTVFFGGGTPTLLPLAAMRRLVEGLRQRFDFSRLEEWTVEANPATVRSEYAQMLRDLGVDRLSFGAQSFDRRELEILERHHDPDDVPRSIDIARSAGFRRLNVDLIYAIPGQTMQAWASSLEQAIALGTPHVSAYALTYEPNTPMAVKKRLDAIRAIDEDVELQMLRFTRQRLADAGLGAYEVSNHAIPGDECRHNLVYWTGGNYVGLGPSAATHVEGWRWKNRPHLREWEIAVDAGTGIPTVEAETLTPRQRAGELAMLRLRLDEGLVFSDFAARTGYDARELFANQIERFANVGLLVVDNQSVRLSDRGLSVADAVAAEFLDV